jgi:hypothetical protein
LFGFADGFSWGLIMLLFIYLYFLATSVLSVTARDIIIDPWVIPMTNQVYPKRAAVVGDTVVFRYVGNHNVYASLSENFSCKITDRSQMVGNIGDETANYTFAALESLVTFFCNYSIHCEVGQQLPFQVYPSISDLPSTGVPSIYPTDVPSTWAPSLAPSALVTNPPYLPLFNSTYAPTGVNSSATLKPGIWKCNFYILLFFCFA